jgi:hypothetical protein
LNVKNIQKHIVDVSVEESENDAIIRDKLVGARG